VHPVGFITRLYHDAQSSEHQIESSYLCRNLIHSQNCVLSLTHSRPVHVRDVCCSAVFGCNLQSIYVSWRKCCRHFCKKGNTLHQWCCVNKQINWIVKEIVTVSLVLDKNKTWKFVFFLNDASNVNSLNNRCVIKIASHILKFPLCDMA
jgi:hypothetical protein